MPAWPIAGRCPVCYEQTRVMTLHDPQIGRVTAALCLTCAVVQPPAVPDVRRLTSVPPMPLERPA